MTILKKDEPRDFNYTHKTYQTAMIYNGIILMMVGWSLANDGNKMSCPQQYNQFSEQCYKYYSNDFKKNWDQARKSCMSFNNGTFLYDLVSIHSKEENHFIQRLISDSTQGLYPWIGLKRTINNFQWVDKSHYNGSHFWFKNEPNNLGGKENCVHIDKYSGRYNDVGCEERRSYICEAQKNKISTNYAQDEKFGNSVIIATKRFRNY